MEHHLQGGGVVFLHTHIFHPPSHPESGLPPRYNPPKTTDKVSDTCPPKIPNTVTDKPNNHHNYPDPTLVPRCTPIYRGKCLDRVTA